jgi:hypothetical protein
LRGKTRLQPEDIRRTLGVHTGVADDAHGLYIITVP